MQDSKDIIIIGGGAAGYFAAIACAAQQPANRVLILERSRNVLNKVRVSGGGRCNVTNACFDPRQLILNYPRGYRELLGPFTKFGPKETREWFESRGVMLKTEDNGRMFPVTGQSMTIVNCLIKEAEKYGVKIIRECMVVRLSFSDGKFFLFGNDGHEFAADRVLIAVGGFPSVSSYEWLKTTGHTIIPPVPSLFTFNMPDNPVTRLMGLSVNDAEVSIRGNHFSNRGPLLITHWGMSGPAILGLSAVAARELSEMNYSFECIVNWIPELHPDSVYDELVKIKNSNSASRMNTTRLFSLPSRLWEFILGKSGINLNVRWADLPSSKLRLLFRTLSGDSYKVQGRTTYREEFVTAGGISLKEIHFGTMESRLVPGLYFAGEILDIDGITGGYNFQAAWTTGFLSGKAMGS